MALSYSVPIGIRRPFEIPFRLLHGSATWIKVCSLDYSWYNLFISGIGYRNMYTLWSHLRYLWCGAWCGTYQRGEMAWSLSMLDDAWCMSCYYLNPVSYVCICYYTLVIMLHMKETVSTWWCFHESFENCRSRCHPDHVEPMPIVDLAVWFALRLKYVREMKVRSDAYCS